MLSLCGCRLELKYRKTKKKQCIDLMRQTTEEEIAKNARISLKGYREVTKVLKPILSLNRKNPVIQKEFIAIIICDVALIHELNGHCYMLKWASNSDPKLVMKGITHGACDYLVKLVRLKELRNVWEHVIRKKVESKSQPKSNNNQDKSNHEGKGGQEADSGDPYGKFNRKRKDKDEDFKDNGNEDDKSSTQKKPRVVWFIELHRKFIAAVNSLGIEKAVPKRILDLMNVEGLTRENVASHLQKYRLYLKRISQQENMVVAFGGVVDWVGKYFLKTIPQGVATTCYMALHQQVKGISGEYFIIWMSFYEQKGETASIISKTCWDFLSGLEQDVYGDPLVHPQDESYWGNVNPIGVRTCYDEGKRVAETLIFNYHRQHGIGFKGHLYDTDTYGLGSLFNLPEILQEEAEDKSVDAQQVDNSPITKLSNTVKGTYKFGMEIHNKMIYEAFKKLARYKYYKDKKVESEKAKASKEPEEKNVSPVKSGRGKGQSTLQYVK
ncbi:two-component response regulator ARR12-like protein [Tanacetum coccineum]|uniref:Two-component response regulator ARR12-like protein n=1 Tax=Tanacetum coccineum TaxID=301880 RepID=A0ABQ5GGC9_9ASTR